MGKVISIRRNGASEEVKARQPLLLTDSFLPMAEEPDIDEVIEADLYKRITYDMIESELSVPLLKPMWPLCSSF